MSLAGFKRLLDAKRNPPKPSTESFTGKTILLTGANAGLGLEAAKKLVALNVDRLIITARDETKGQATKRELERWLQERQAHDPKTTPSTTEIIPMVLSMNSFATVQEFAKSLAAKFPDGIDAAILNAGMLRTQHADSSDGWEETFQVNTLSTFLLGLLILPLLITRADSQKNPTYKPHLTFISSGTAMAIETEKMRSFLGSDTPLRDLTQEKSFPPGIGGGSNQYARSKLTLEYAVRHLAASPALRDTDGKPKVIVNTTCPGLCKSDLGRDAVKGSFLGKILQLIFHTIFARTGEQGANTYTTALERGEETHGQMWKNDEVFTPGPMLRKEEAMVFGERLWKDVLHVMLEADSSTKVFFA